jgi:integrase
VTMQWPDLNLETGVWTIRTEAREKGNPGTLKLPKTALDILQSQPRFAGNPCVFARARGRGHLENLWDPRRHIDDKLPKDMLRWTLHDLRRTARTLLSRTFKDPADDKKVIFPRVISEIAERVIGHAIGGVEGIYDRHEYEGEIAEALENLAAKIAYILNPPELQPAADNVVQLRAAAS